MSLDVSKAARNSAAAIDAYDEDYAEHDLAFVEAQDVETDSTAEPIPAMPPVQETSPSESNLVGNDESDEQEGELVEDAEVVSGSVDEVDIGREHGATAEHHTAADGYAESVPSDGLIFEEEFEAAPITIEEIIASETVDVDQLPDDIDSYSEDDEFLRDEIYPDDTTDAVLEEAFELSWEEMDELESYTPTPQEQPIQVKGTSKLSREQRARQVAIDVMTKLELGREFLPFLQMVFCENGWGAARVAIERELSRGVSLEELSLAREIRHFWWQSERYWTTFGFYPDSMPFGMAQLVD